MVVPGIVATGVETFSGESTARRDAPAVTASTVVSFIGVNTAVNAISPLAGDAIDGPGAGNCGALVTAALGPLPSGEDCGGIGAANVVGIGASAAIAAKTGISDTLRNCFLASVATGGAAVGAGDGLAV